LTLDELHRLNQQVCYRIGEIRTQQDKMVLAALRPGMTVQFKHEAQTLTGVLLKKNRKTVIVALDNGKKHYTVPAGMVAPVYAMNPKISQAVKMSDDNIV
tara:strand:+ start:306 stop:605 length:300 start_codon:yes stop_codon:yes gene_type:complete